MQRGKRRAESGAARKELEDATSAYYLSLRDAEQAEEDALARALSKAARRVSYDVTVRARRRRATA